MQMPLTPQEFALPALETDDLSFFVSYGLRNLMRAMLRQTIKDIVADRKDSHAAADVSASARWLHMPGGRDCIEFLMPGVTPERVIAKIYKDPQLVLDAMDRADADTALCAHVEPAATFTLQASAASVAFDAEEALALQGQGNDYDVELALHESRPWG